MNEKIALQKEIEYYNNFEIVGKTIIKWRKLKPDNKDINAIYKAWQQVGFYAHELIDNQDHFNESMSQYAADKLRAVNRARFAEKEIENLKKSIIE
tara:strand:- start:2068 stop:2355 length:288 start_codon:yes stop_codon:yes gene_type:complete